MLSPEQRKQFFALARKLKKEHPIGRVTIRFVPKEKIDGEADCGKTKKWFVLRIGRELSLTNAQYALCEEWAHAMVWDKIGTEEIFEMELPENVESRKLHCKDWALAYMRTINTRTDHQCT